MIQLNLLPAKEWLFKNWAIVALVVVSFLYFKSCQGGNELKSSLVASKAKQESYLAIAKTNEDAAVFYRTQANNRKGKIANLEKEVVDLKASTIAVDNKTKERVKKVQNYTSQEIKKYYVKEFKYLDIPIVAAGLVHSDSLNKMIITVIEKGKGTAEKLQITEKALTKSEEANTELKQANGELEKSNDSFSVANDNLEKANKEANNSVKIVEKSLRKERNKKTFWQVTSGVILAGASYLLIVK
ncbi:MAG: hypothetical protein H7Y10_03600 [Flavobacterium sp.]|nr:hypothetical protein [Flavobacterium sp.]